MPKDEKKQKKPRKIKRLSIKKEKKAVDEDSAKAKRISQIPFESTQQNIIIEDFYKGIVVTADNRYIKVMEVAPMPFLLLTESGRRKVIRNFQSALTDAPDTVQFTAINLPADLSLEKQHLNTAMKNEPSMPLHRMAEEYESVLTQHEASSLQRRFFISFEYIRDARTHRTPDIDLIVDNLEATAHMIEGDLADCGNVVIHPKEGQDINEFTAEIYYTMLNRKQSAVEPFKEHLQKTYQRYIDNAKTSDDARNVYVSPAEYLAPKSLDFRDSKYINVNGDTYYTFAYIPTNGYACEVEDGWLNPFINIEAGVDVSVYLHRDSSKAILHKIQRAIKNNKGDAYAAKSDTDDADNSQSALIGGQYLRNGIKHGGFDFYYAAVMITVMGDTPEEVDERFDYLQKSALKSSLDIKRYKFQMEQAFWQALPLAKYDTTLFEKSKRNMLTNGAASMYPFTTYELINPNGVLLGTDEMTNSPVITDMWDNTKFMNMNLGIFGTTGSGKTVTLLTYASRLRMLQIPIMIIACEKEHEYARVTKAMGGKYISMASGSKDRINLMEIFPRDTAADEEIYGTTNRSYLAEKVDTIVQFIELRTGKLSPDIYALLTVVINNTYADFGITDDNESLIDETDPEHKRFKRMPIISDLRDKIIESKNNKLMFIADVLAYFTHGAAATAFNGQTNVELDNKWIVFGMEGMNDNDFPSGMFLVIDYIWSQIKTDTMKPKAVLFDEFWKVCRSTASVKLASKMIKLVRAYSCSMVVATQEMTDLLKYDNGDLGETILSNTATRIMLGMKEEEALQVRKIIRLTDAQTDRVLDEKPGHALLIAGRTSINLQVDVGTVEMLLVGTDKKTLQQWKEHKNEINEYLYGMNIPSNSSAVDTSDIGDDTGRINTSVIADISGSIAKPAVSNPKLTNFFATMKKAKEDIPDDNDDDIELIPDIPLDDDTDDDDIPFIPG